MDIAADASPWRGILFFAALLASGVIWSLVRRRLAPRTIRNWAGRGICRDLTPAQAAVLIRTHPALTLAVVVGDLVARGAARLESTRPPILDWPDREPSGPVEEALARAVAEDGRVDAVRALEVLEALHDEVETIMAPWSGRATAVYCRTRARKALERVVREGRLAEEDVPWLLLEDQGRVYDAVLSDPPRQAVRAIVRFGGAFRGHLFPDEVLRRRADEATEGYFAYRRDLLTGRGCRAPERPEGARRPSGTGMETLAAVAETLEGHVVTSPPVLPIGGPNFGPVAIGRIDGRPASVLFGESGEMDLEVRAGSTRRFRVGTEGRSGEVDHLSLEPLAPYLEVWGFGSRVRLRVEYDRERVRPAEVISRLRALAAFVARMEEAGGGGDS